MAENYKIATKEELIDKVNEELEVLETIFDGEGVVIAKAEALQQQDVDAIT